MRHFPISHLRTQLAILSVIFHIRCLAVYAACRGVYHAVRTKTYAEDGRVIKRRGGFKFNPVKSAAGEHSAVADVRERPVLSPSERAVDENAALAEATVCYDSAAFKDAAIAEGLVFKSTTAKHLPICHSIPLRR